jgi:Fusaric acid resistance protein-like
VLGALLGVVLVITVTGAWGLVVTLFVLAVVAISLIRVNYGLAVVFITPLVLVLLNIPHPGQW